MMMFMNHGESSCSSNNNKDRSSSAFTASQWHELEQQALIFKYMSKGLPIPPDLIYPIRRSCPPPLIPHHPNILGRLDPEPGRCRRTDGKKWRCSKKAFPDSKYCERHMHRGKNRSRKPVEIDLSSSTTTTTTTFKSIPTQTHLRLDHGSLSAPHKDYRFGEHGFFSEPSRNTHVDAGGWRSTVTVAAKPPAWMMSDLERIQGREEQQQRCFVVGDDFKPLKVERGEEGEEKQKLRHFFDEDEWHSPRKNRVPSWIDIEQDLSNATQLSISIPAAPSHHDFMK